MSVSIWNRRGRAALVATTLLASCGGGGSSSGGAPIPSPDPMGPSTQLNFPAARSITDQDTITVTGSASDPSGVERLSVNGIPATTDDRFATWSVTLSLVPGENILSLESADLNGNVTSIPVAGVIRYVGPYLAGTQDIRMPGIGSEAVVVDAELNALLGIELNEGHRRVLSSNGTGSGAEFVNPSSVAVFDSGTEALVLDQGARAILRVDLLTGDRIVVSDDTQLANGSYLFTRSLALDEAGNQAFVTLAVGSGDSGLYSVDLDTGNVSPRSTNNTGVGPGFSQPRGLDLDLPNDRAFVVDASNRTLVEVNLTTGNRVVRTAPFLGNGPNLSDPSAVRYDATGDVVYLVDRNLAALLSVDLASGDRTVISDSTTGTGPELLDIVGLELDMAVSRVLVTLEDAVVAVDLLTGDRSGFSDSNQGLGPILSDPTNAYGHLREGKIVVQVTDAENNTPGFMLTRVDLETGNRDLSASSTEGSGLQVLRQFAFECDRTLSKAVAFGQVLIGGRPKNAVYTIDLTSSDKELNHVFEGTSFFLDTGDVEFDGSNSMAFVAFENQIWKVDLNEGGAELLSGPGVGLGPELIEVRRIVLDLSMDRLLATDVGRGSVMRVFLKDGDRSEVTGPLVGSGPLSGGIRGIDLDRYRRDVVFTDDVSKSVYLAKIATGDRRLLFDAEAPDSLFPGDTPTDVVVDSRKNVAYVTFEGDLDALLMIELDSLNRVIVSR